VLLEVLGNAGSGPPGAVLSAQEARRSYFKLVACLSRDKPGAILLRAFPHLLLMGLFKGHSVLGILVGIVGGLLTGALFLGMVSAGMVAHDFVIPIMYRENIFMKEAGINSSGRRLFHIQGIVKYLLVVMALSIAAVVIQSIVSVVAALAGLVAGGALVVPGIILIKLIPLTKVPFDDPWSGSGGDVDPYDPPGDRDGDATGRRIFPDVRPYVCSASLSGLRSFDFQHPALVVGAFGLFKRAC